MKKEIKKIIESAIRKLQAKEIWPDFDLPEIMVENTREEKFGDYSTNVAMVLGKNLKKNPIEVAESIKNKVESIKQKEIKKIEVAKPGYINFYLSEEYFHNLIGEINNEDEKFGDSDLGKGQKVNNEFISANPTGPLHLGNGRGGFYGDVLSKVLRKNGFEVANEYYVNDAGEQILKLGHSVLKDDEACYSGDYIDELNKKYGSLPIKEAGQKSGAYILENIIKKTIEEKMKVGFDEWVSEKDIVEKEFVDRAIEILKKKNLVYEKEEATWLKTTEFGDDKDRVLIKKDGQKTYFASDCGYILNKMERGFDSFIEIWGADHHGYIGRFKAAAKALGFSGEIKFIIVQLVRLVKDGKEVRMSKRAGNVVYINDLISEVGHDVARFIFLMYSPDTHMNFDLGVAKEKSEKNPVFYVQYAYARISSIKNKVESSPHPALRATLSRIQERGNNEASLLKHEKEMSLMRELNKFPELVEEIAGSYEVHKLPQYAIKLADKFHSFYNECRVIDEENPELTAARLELVGAVKIVLGETLRLIGVNAPEKM